MSIQQHRENVSRLTPAAAAVDAKFVNDTRKSYAGLKAKGSVHPADLRRLQNSVADWGTTAIRNGAGDEALDWAVAFKDMLQCEIDTLVFANSLIPGALNGAAQPSGWVNAETGEPIRLFAPSEKISDERPAQTRVGAASLGSVIEAMFFGPKQDSVRNALCEGTDSAGGFSVPLHILPAFIDRLRAQTQFINAGSRTMMLEGGKTRIVRTDTDPAAAWRAESAAIAEGQPSFSAVELLPKSLAVMVKASRELVADSVNLADALEASLVGAMSVELDRAAFFGAGSATEPKGLFNITGINSVSMGTNGATPTNYDNLLDALYELEVGNAAAPTAAIWHPRTAKTYRKLKDTTNQPLVAPEPIASLPKLSTTSVPIAQTQGTSSDCSTVLMGDFSQAILGIRESLNIVVLRELFATTGEIAFIAHIRADVAFAHPESFVKLIGIKP